MTTTQTDHAAVKIDIAKQVLDTPNSKALGKVATEILIGLDPSDLQIADLKKLIAKYEERTSATFLQQQKQAEQILGSLKMGPNGSVELTIPAGLSDIDAMKALNAYFKDKLPSRNRAAICEGDLDWYANQPTVSGRDITKERTININPFVEGTIGKDRADQEKVLKKAGMTFAAPEEVALVVAAYACKNDGKDLLNDNWTRTAAAGVALYTLRNLGVYVNGYSDNDVSYVGASGVALPAN